MSKNIYVCFPIVSSEDGKRTRTMLSDLGKATKRGIKKCHSCGVYNGTRGIVCKNKQCNAIFKDGSEKRKPNLEAIKLVTSAQRKVYSVRVRDRGPEHRGFVQLPEQTTFPQIALCFVDSCQRLFDVSILKCHESEPTHASATCVHIESALKSATSGVALELKPELFDLLNVSQQTKQKLWTFHGQTDGPLVQRVSKQVAVIRCRVTPKHPLGYLHFTFFASRGREGYDKWFCGCSEVTSSHSALPSLSVQEKNCNISHTSISNNDEFPSTSSNAATNDGAMNLSLKESSVEKYTESNSWHFIDWLSSVTESMNQKLTFELSKRKESLVFHIPEKFFRLLKERISSHYSKVEIISPPTEPQGTSVGMYSYKYTWDITDIFNIKQILDTNLVQVQTSKLYVINTIQEGNEEYETLCIIKLEVNGKVDQDDYCPFLIEWIPTSGSVSEFGQLRLEFTIDYKLNNTHEKRKSKSS